MESIPFHLPTSLYFKNSFNFQDGESKKKVSDILSTLLDHQSFYFVPSCFSALELAAFAIQFKENEEVIIPSFIHVSVANAFQRAGAKLVFVDSMIDSMNMDPLALKKAISPQTKAVVFMHYSGNSDGFGEVKNITEENGLILVEDAAQCIGSFRKGKHLGTFGDFGCISFDYQKNIECGQGGLLIVNNKDYISRIDALYYNGTNQVAYMKKEVAVFEWDTYDGGNYRFSNHLFHLLLPQFQKIDFINQKKIEISKKNLSTIMEYDDIPLSHFRINEEGNQQTNWILFSSRMKAEKFISSNQKKSINVQKHYYPLHLSKLGRLYRFHETSGAANLSKDLVRLPNHLFL